MRRAVKNIVQHEKQRFFFGIRLANSADAKQIQQFVKQSRRKIGLDLDLTDTDQDLDRFDVVYGDSHSSNNMFLIAEDRWGRIVGTCAVFFSSSDLSEIRKVYIDSAWQGQGLGRRLMAAALTYARDNGARVAELETTRNWTRTINFFRSFGFRPTEARVHSRLGDIRFRLDFLESFSSQDPYLDVYRWVKYLDIYCDAKNTLVSWAVEWTPRLHNGRPIILDAGGGSGFMAVEMKAQRPDADIILIDKEIRMLEAARLNGLAEANLGHCSITEMQVGLGANALRIANNSVHHINTHSVIWLLDDPSEFFAESLRVLHPCGTVAISTIAQVNPRLVASFLRHLRENLLRHPDIPRDEIEIFVGRNKDLICNNIRSPLPTQDLINLAGRHGFRVLEQRDAYVINGKPMFTQVLFAKVPISSE